MRCYHPHREAAMTSDLRPILQPGATSQVHFAVRGPFNRRIGSIKAVDGVSFDLMPGEVFGLVGESGCGKSTLGKAIMGIHKPTAGEIWFEGAAHRPAGAGRAGAPCAAACNTPIRTPGRRSIRAGRSAARCTSRW